MESLKTIFITNKYDHFTMWKTQRHVKYYIAKFSFNHATFYWSACTMSGEWPTMYLCAKGVNFVSFYDLHKVWTVGQEQIQ